VSPGGSHQIGRWSRDVHVITLKGRPGPHLARAGVHRYLMVQA
jgi:hypothetical protein